MKKITLSLLSILSINAFAATNSSDPLPKDRLDLTKMACYCEKHKMIFEIKNGESIAEMGKHCMINEDRKNSMVKFFDDYSEQIVKCNVTDEKLILNSCQKFNHIDKDTYKKSSKLNASEYNSISAH